MRGRLGLALWGLLGRTMLGWKIRAAVEDPETLAASGTNVKLLFTTVFAIGSLLAGFGGAVIAPLQAVGPGMGEAVIISAFIVTVIGGLGSIAGAAIGAVIIGAFEAAGILYVPSWAPASMFVAMIVVLALRPAGLLGQSLEYCLGLDCGTSGLEILPDITQEAHAAQLPM